MEQAKSTFLCAHTHIYIYMTTQLQIIKKYVCSVLIRLGQKPFQTFPRLLILIVYHRPSNMTHWAHLSRRAVGVLSL